MKHRTIKLAACLVFQLAGWIVFFLGNGTVACACLALGNYFSRRRSYLVIGLLVAAFLFTVGLDIYQHEYISMKMHFSNWFRVFIGSVFLLTLFLEFRAWRADLKNDRSA
jgi:uncharacterized membrane protein YczE